MSVNVIIVLGRECETLQEVADVVYGDSTKWKDIAAVNGIDHPANIPDGIQNIILPEVQDLEEEDEETEVFV